MRNVSIHAAKARFFRMIALVVRGEEIRITRAGRPVALLVPYRRARGRPRRPIGLFAGKVRSRAFQGH
jgi:prevent-host-death family protein